jgi:hypothetical protein
MRTRAALQLEILALQHQLHVLGAPKAITAMAHKLARLVYRMLRWGHDYVDKGLQYYEDQHRQQQLRSLQEKALKLGLLIVEPCPA